jgi:hypothetical protein
MAIDLYASLTSLAGVMLGGGLSFVVQRMTRRTAERTEEIRLEAVRREARRSERMTAVQTFLANVQEVERLATDRHQHGAGGPEWRRSAEAAMDRVWISEKVIRILCSPDMHEAAHTFTDALHDVVWADTLGCGVGDALAPGREACLVAARDELEQLEQAGRHA